MIVIASVETNRVVAKHVEAAHYPNVYLDLHAVRCKRENSLRGGLAERELEFFYFADGGYPDSQPNTLRSHLFQAEPGSRYIFFLTREGSVFRSIGDVGDFSIRVASGAHPETPVKDGEIGTQLSKILLTPGEGVDLSRMAKRVPDYSRIADVWGSRPLTVQLLRRLISLPEPVRSQACGVLATFYQGQEDCLQAMAADPNESPENRREALRELKEQVGSRERLIESLKDPATLVDLAWAGDSRHRIREEFQTMLLGTNAVLHERVCTALKRYYPYDPEPGCTAGRQGLPRQ